MKRSIATVTTAVTVAVLTAVTPASAEAPVDEPGTRWTEPPGWTITYRAPAVAGPGVADGAPTAFAHFAPPPNDDFVLRFAPDVPATKRAAFEAAAGVWSSVLEVEVPIEIGVSLESFADPGILGGAVPGDLVANHPSFPRVNTWYPSALANQFARHDLDPDRVEVDVVISADHDFHEGVDGHVPPDRISLLALAVHELGHGLGHTTLAQRFPDGTGTIRHEGLPLTYDLALRTPELVPLVALDPADLGDALTGPVVWGGREGILDQAGTPPALYAPPLFQAGSSVSHLDEATFGDALMTPFLADGEAQTTVPTLTRAMFADFGWGLEVAAPSEALVAAISRDFVKRFPTPSELALLVPRLDSGSVTQHEVARAYGYSDDWIGAVVHSHYLSVLGRPAGPEGLARWTDELREGAPTAALVAALLSSSEYFTRAGGTNQAWVRALYGAVLGREPDADGWASWTRALDDGASRASVAATVHQSTESRARRVTDLYRSLLGRDPDAAGLATWTKTLHDGRDIDFAVGLASSREYRERAILRFG